MTLKTLSPSTCSFSGNVITVGSGVPSTTFAVGDYIRVLGTDKVLSTDEAGQNDGVFKSTSLTATTITCSAESFITESATTGVTLKARTTTFVKNDDIVEEGIGNLLTFFHGKENMAGFLTPFLEQIQELENVWFDLYLLRTLTYAYGDQLDMLGSIVGEPRKGKDDVDYIAAISGKIRINRMNSRIEEVILAMELTHPAAYELRERGNAKFMMGITDQWLTGSDPSLAVLDAALQHAKGGGIGALLQYTIQDDADTFRFADGEYQDTMISGHDSTRVGGYVMHDEGDGVIRNLGTGVDATNNGATNVITDLGLGLSFDGDGDYAEEPNGANLNPVDYVTVSCWALMDTDTRVNYVVSKSHTGTSQQYEIQINSANRAHFLVETDIGVSDATSADTLVSGKLYHIVGVYDGVTAEVYVDKVIGSSGATITGGVMSDNGYGFTIGGRRSTYGLFDGDIIDPQIFSEAKDAAWVAAEYAKGITAMANNQSADYPVHRAHIDTLDSSLVAAYRMKPTNGVTGSNVPNLIDVDVAAAVNNGAAFEYALAGDSMVFDDGSSDHVTMGGTPLATVTDDFAISVKIKPNTTASNKVILAKGSAPDWELSVNASGQVVFTDGSTSITSTATVDDGDWHHAGVLVDTESVLYVDGVYQSLATLSINNSSLQTVVGATYGSTERFDGSIGDILIHDEAKNAAWVLAEYNKGVAVIAANTLSIDQGWADDPVTPGDITTSTQGGYWSDVYVIGE